MDSRASIGETISYLDIIRRILKLNHSKENVTPLILFDSEDTGSLSIRINSADIPSLLAQVKSKWKAVSPNLQFSYSFMDEDFDNNYRTEQRIGQIAISFTIHLTIVIACLGLFWPGCLYC